MFNFSGNGNKGLFGGAPITKVITQNGNRETRIDPDDNEAGSIDFWYEYALGLKKNIEGLVEIKDEAQRIAIERRAVDAGLRAVIRELLGALRENQPGHPLLDKKNRDAIFSEYQEEELAKVIKATGKNSWPRERPNENQSE